MHVIVLRGPVGVGKSTVARAVQRELGYPTAQVDTDVLNWQFVPGESNKTVVYALLQQIVAGYLSYGYHVVISGAIPAHEERGALTAIAARARADDHDYVEYFGDAPVEVCLARSAERDLDLDPVVVERWWHESRTDRDAAQHVLDLTLPVEQNVALIMAALGARPD